MPKEVRSHRPLRVDIPKEAHDTYGGRSYVMWLHREGKPKVMRENSVTGVLTLVKSGPELVVVAEWARRTVDAKKALIDMQKQTEAAAKAHQLRWTYRIGRFVRRALERAGVWFTKELRVFDPHAGDEQE